jgi:hypothetical protein
MKTGFILRLAVTGLVSFGLVVPQIAIAGPSPAGIATSAEAVTPLVTEVKKKGKGKWQAKGLKNPHWKGNKKWKGNNKWKGGKKWKGHPRHGYVRSWHRRPYYGNVIGGVALGTILGVAIAGSVPRARSSDLCWYWTNPARTHGYWDYCY